HVEDVVVNGIGVVSVFRPTLERNERERNAVDVDMLRRQQSGLGIGRVAYPPESAANDLLAQQLACERPDPKNMRHVVSVPALSEHRHGNDAPDVLTKVTALADGIYDLAQR